MREYEPRLPRRHAGLISLDWSNCAADVFHERWLEWEVGVQRYEMKHLMKSWVRRSRAWFKFKCNLSRAAV